MECTGTILVIEPIKNITDNFQVREFAVEIGKETPYPQKVLFKAVNKMATVMNQYAPGDEVRVCFNIKGREAVVNGETKYYNSLEVWKILNPNAE